MSQLDRPVQTQRALQDVWRAGWFLSLVISVFALDLARARAQERGPALHPTQTLLRKIENESQNFACPGSFSAELRKQSLDEFAWRKESSVAGVEAWTGVDGFGWAVAEVKFSSLESRFKIWRNAGSQSVRFKANECGQFVYEDLSS